MLLFLFSIFSDLWSLKIENEKKKKTSGKYKCRNLTTEVSYIGSLGPKNKFESGRVNKPSGFEPLKFYCN